MRKGLLYLKEGMKTGAERVMQITHREGRMGDKGSILQNFIDLGKECRCAVTIHWPVLSRGSTIVIKFN